MLQAGTSMLGRIGRERKWEVEKEVRDKGCCRRVLLRKKGLEGGCQKL